MQWSEISFAPPARALRQFAALWILFFGGLACWQWLGRDHFTLALIFVLLAVSVGPVGLVRPQAIRLVLVGWMILAFPIGWMVSRIVLACVYYGVITPMGLFFKVTGRDVLCRRFRSDNDTYWTRKPAAADPRSYFRQF